MPSSLSRASNSLSMSPWDMVTDAAWCGGVLLLAKDVSSAEPLCVQDLVSRETHRRRWQQPETRDALVAGMDGQQLPVSSPTRR